MVWRHLEWSDVVGGDVVMIDPATIALSVLTPVRYGWNDVVDEITSSCIRRAESGQLLAGPGVVGVLAGAAPVVWVHGPANATYVSDALVRSPQVDEVYVAAGQQAVADVLCE